VYYVLTAYAVLKTGHKMQTAQTTQVVQMQALSKTMQIVINLARTYFHDDASQEYIGEICDALAVAEGYPEDYLQTILDDSITTLMDGDTVIDVSRHYTDV
jgi:hypothetical protein